MLHCVGQLECLSYKSFKTIKECNDNTIALVQCRKSDLISELEPEALVLALLTLAMPLTLILLIKPLALTLISHLIFDIGPGLLTYFFTDWFGLLNGNCGMASVAMNTRPITWI